MNKIVSILVLIIGILWILPLIGVAALDAVDDWVVALIVLVIGILGLLEPSK